MRIKLHNSMGKINRDYNLRFLVNESLYIRLSCRSLLLFYRINDDYPFLRFSPETKEFKKDVGFGKDHRNPNSKWWKTYSWKWKEIGKEDENQST